MASQSPKTYKGSCHCKHVRYTATIDLSAKKATKCNCSICVRQNNLQFSTEQANVQLDSPAEDDADLGKYEFGTKRFAHYFCRRCGISMFCKGGYEMDGVRYESTVLNLTTLDDGQGVDFREFTIGYWDGKGENWEGGLGEKPFEGGCY